MTNEIIQKLNQHIAGGLTREADVTYLFVQLGKLVERERPGADYAVLRFYRNWVVHEKVSRVNANPPMRDILNTFEAILEAGTAGGTTMQLARQVADSVSLQKLEDDINRVFDDFPDFHRGSANRPENWPHFQPLLLSILADIALQADNSYRYLHEVKIDSSSRRFDTLVLIDRSGKAVDVPLMP